MTGERQDGSLYGNDPYSCGTWQTGDRSDPGDRTDVSDCHAVLQEVRRPGFNYEFQAFCGERYDQMMRAKQGEIDVMIGPRSALFTPFPNLGLVVIDEEHEPTYKSEQIPRYHAGKLRSREQKKRMLRCPWKCDALDGGDVPGEEGRVCSV